MLKEVIPDFYDSDTRTLGFIEVYADTDAAWSRWENAGCGAVINHQQIICFGGYENTVFIPYN